jgi:hypothetical protein
MSISTPKLPLDKRHMALIAAFVGFAAAYAHAADSIQMLPPVAEGVTTVCPPGARTPLTWDGQTALACAQGVTISGGKVGIGTSNPLTQLHVVEPSEGGSPGILVEETAGIYGSPRIEFVDTSLGPDTSAPAWAVDNLHDRFRIFRQPNAFAPGWEGMTITNMGNVGIGALNPPYTLTVAPFDQHDGSAGLGISWNNMVGNGETDFYNYGGAGPGGFAFFNYSYPGPTLGPDNAYPTTGATNLMTIQGTGRVGIGTAAPQGTLDVESGEESNALCVNGGCVGRVPTNVITTIAVLQGFHPSCTGDTNTITADGAFTSWCTAACNRYCASLGYKGGLINEYDVNIQTASCGCF